MKAWDSIEELSRDHNISARTGCRIRKVKGEASIQEVISSLKRVRCKAGYMIRVKFGM
jgi:hypothetical protein